MVVVLPAPFTRYYQYHIRFGRHFGFKGIGSRSISAHLPVYLSISCCSKAVELSGAKVFVLGRPLFNAPNDLHGGLIPTSALTSASSRLSSTSSSTVLLPAIALA